MSCFTSLASVCRAPGARTLPSSFLDVMLGRLDLLGGLWIFRLADKFVHTRRAAEFVSLAVDNPGEVVIGFGQGDRANLVPRLRLQIVGGRAAFEFLRRCQAAVGFDVCLRVFATRRQV